MLHVEPTDVTRWESNVFFNKNGDFKIYFQTDEESYLSVFNQILYTFRFIGTDEIANWQTYDWNKISFEYPSNWNVGTTYYQTPAQQASGIPTENIGLTIFPGVKSIGNDFIAIGGHQVSCDPSENHTKCQFISSIANFIYTDSNNPDIVNIFDQILSTFKFLE